jgi:hypothetical protein
MSTISEDGPAEGDINMSCSRDEDHLDKSQSSGSERPPDVSDHDIVEKERVKTEKNASGEFNECRGNVPEDIIPEGKFTTEIHKIELRNIPKVGYGVSPVLSWMWCESSVKLDVV